MTSCIQVCLGKNKSNIAYSFQLLSRETLLYTPHFSSYVHPSFAYQPRPPSSSVMKSKTWLKKYGSATVPLCDPLGISFQTFLVAFETAYNCFMWSGLSESLAVNFFFGREKSVVVVLDIRTITYGTISSFNPLIKRIGTLVICGITSLLGQIWWQNRAMYFAGGITLKGIST